MAVPTCIPASASYYDLGKYHRQVTASVDDARVWFNRGLVWSYGFNHQASIECFEQALLHDSKCTMAYWGLAYALGPNYNKPWEVFDQDECMRNLKRARWATAQAQKVATQQTSVESALANAITYRYPLGEDFSNHPAWNKRYADEMRKVYQKFPDDLDVAALYADALMNLTPWNLWDLKSGRPYLGADTLEIKAILDAAFSQDVALQHPGLLHLYIHLMEMSSIPESALPIANRLRGLVPDAGHLNHMPTHLDVLCGDYQQAMASNSEAIRADEKFLAQAGAINFYTLYRCHDYHFKIYAAMFAGQSETALSTVAQLEKSLPDASLRVESPPMADWLEGFLAMQVHALIRFGRWQDIIALSLPVDQSLYCVTTAMIYYAKGVALSATGATEQANHMRTNFVNSVALVKPSRTLFNNTCLDILAIAEQMLNGELEYRLGNIERAFQHLRNSIELEDTLPYDEPWGWMQPSRHAYGALLLEQGRTEEAAAVYCADLGLDDTLPRALQHPNNVWALHGYHECLKRLGKNDEAGLVKQQLELASTVADVEIQSSCFCRRAGFNNSSSESTREQNRCCTNS